LVWRWQADTNGAVEECLNAGCRGGKLSWFENFEVAAANLNAPVKKYFKNPR
jgi:hypothetical protein